MRLLVPVRLAFGMVLALLGGLSFHRVFESGDLVKPLALGLAIGLVVPLAFALAERFGAWLVVTVSIVVFIVGSATVLFGSPLEVGDVLSGIVNGWDRILTTTLPASATPDLVLIPALVVWFATLAAVLAALSGSTGVVIAAGPLMGFVAGTAVSAGGEGSSIGLAVVFAAVTGLLLAWDAVSERLGNDRGDMQGVRGSLSDPDRRNLVLAPFAVVAVVVLVGAVVAPSLPGAAGAEPTVLRRDPPNDELNVANPIALVTSALRLPSGETGDGSAVGDCEMLTVTRRSDGALPGFLRLAALEDYDGVTWSTEEELRPADSTIPDSPLGSVDAAAERSQALEYEIEIDDRNAAFGRQQIRCGWAWPGAGFLPVFDRPSQVSACGGDDEFPVLYQPQTGNIATREVVPGLRYCVESELAPDGAASGAVFPPISATRLIALPAPLPVALQQGPRSIISLPEEGRALPLDDTERLEKLQRFLTNATNFVLVEPATARTGHDLGFLQKFMNPVKLTPTKPPGGSYEQYATLFATAARQLGLPARVTVGFRIPDGSRDEKTVTLRASDLRVWPEVAYPGLGWVAFEPFPPLGDPADQPEPEPPTPEADPDTNPNSNVLIRTRPAVTGDSESDGSPLGGILRIVIIVGVLALLAAGPVILLLKRRRASLRRQLADPTERTVGAWREALDSLDDHRVAGLETSTAAEVADRAEVVSAESSESLAPLGQLANAALFDPNGVDDGTAGRAWELLESFQSTLRTEQTFGNRARAALSLRSLRKRRGASKSSVRV